MTAVESPISGLKPVLFMPGPGEQEKGTAVSRRALVVGSSPSFRRAWRLSGTRLRPFGAKTAVWISAAG
jgi:hypothetical protein